MPRKHRKPKRKQNKFSHPIFSKPGTPERLPSDIFQVISAYLLDDSVSLNKLKNYLESSPIVSVDSGRIFYRALKEVLTPYLCLNLDPKQIQFTVEEIVLLTTRVLERKWDREEFLFYCTRKIIGPNLIKYILPHCSFGHILKAFKMIPSFLNPVASTNCEPAHYNYELIFLALFSDLWKIDENATRAAVESRISDFVLPPKRETSDCFFRIISQFDKDLISREMGVWKVVSYSSLEKFVSEGSLQPKKMIVRFNPFDLVYHLEIRRKIFLLLEEKARCEAQWDHNAAGVDRDSIDDSLLVVYTEFLKTLPDHEFLLSERSIRCLAQATERSSYVLELFVEVRAPIDSRDFSVINDLFQTTKNSKTLQSLYQEVPNHRSTNRTFLRPWKEILKTTLPHILKLRNQRDEMWEDKSALTFKRLVEMPLHGAK